MSFAEDLDELIRESDDPLLRSSPRWQRVRLGDICEIISGFPWRSIYFNPKDGTPIVRIRDVIYGETKTYYDGPIYDGYWVEDGDLLVGMDGDFNVRRWQSNRSLLNQRVCKLSVDERYYNRRFLEYVLPPYLSLINAKTGSVTVKHLSSRTLERVPLPLPPLGEQVRIVEALDAAAVRLDRAGASVKASAQMLTQLRRKILSDGVLGVLTADWRQNSGPLETVEEILARVPAPHQQVGGSKSETQTRRGAAAISLNNPHTGLPEGWSWVAMQRVAALGTGHTPSRTNPFYWGGSIPWIALPDARDNHGRYIETTVQTITEAGLANSAARLHDANTVCLSRTASVGYVTIMAQSMATSQDFATWTCTEALLPEYLMYALLAEGDELRSFGMGSIHTTIYFPQLRALHIALPPLPEQTEVVRRLEGLLRRVEQQESELERVRSLLISVRHAFLTKAVAGELVSAVLDEGTPMALRRRIAARAKARPSKARRAPRGSGPRSLVPIEEPRQKEGSMDKTRLDVPPELLSRLVAEHGGSIRTEVLWRASGLRVDEFYKLLREEFASKRLKQSEEKDKIVDAN